MKNLRPTGLILATLLMALLPPAMADAGDKPTVEDQMAGVQGMCEASADARMARQENKSLYERLGGYDRIHELTLEIVRRHQINPDFEVMFKHIDGDDLAKHVADFMAAGTGGTEKYTGRSLPASHAHLRLTDADFLSAGNDVGAAMKHLGYGQEEIEEVICILVSLKDQVVFE